MGARHLERDPTVAAVGASLIIALGAVLVLIRAEVDSTVIALILACGVAIVGQVGGRLAGVAAAIAAALSFNFFHTQPYLSLRIHDVDDVATTLTLLAVGLVAGAGGDLALWWHRRADRAIDELRAVERVARLLSNDTDTHTLTDAATAAVADLLGLASCEFEPGPNVPADAAVLTDHGAFGGQRDHVYRDDGFELPPNGIALRVSHRGVPLGHLWCVPAASLGVPLDRRRAAITVAALLGAGLASR